VCPLAAPTLTRTNLARMAPGARAPTPICVSAEFIAPNAVSGATDCVTLTHCVTCDTPRFARSHRDYIFSFLASAGAT